MNKVVTTWEVDDFLKNTSINEQFGIEPLNQEIMDRFKKIVGKELHPWIRRGMHFSHRNFNKILDAFEAKQPIFIYTGLGSTTEVLHIGHIIPFLFTKWLQDVFQCYVVIQISDDEKSKDIIAVGFKPEKTFIFSDHNYRLTTPKYEELVEEMSKKISFCKISKLFGFDEASNIGMISWPIYQTAGSFYQAYPHLFLPSNPALCLVVHAIDQDPYVRLAKSLSKKISNESNIFYPPCSIIYQFNAPLSGSNEKITRENLDQTTLFLTDSSEEILFKIKKSSNSGNLKNDISWQCLLFFEEDDSILLNILEGFKKDQISSEKEKGFLIAKVTEFIVAHQRKRSQVTDEIVQYFYSKFKYMPIITSPYSKNPPCFSYPGTLLPKEIIPIITENVTKQLNNIGTHTRTLEAEGGFEQVQSAEREYIYWIGKFFFQTSSDIKSDIDGYLCGGGTEANIQGLWIQRNRFLRSGKKTVHVYFTNLTHYSIVKACDLLAIPPSHQHIVPLNNKYEFNYIEFQKIVQTFDFTDGHIVVLTLGSTLTGGCDNIKKVNKICDSLPGEVSIHIDAAFGGFTVPFLTSKHLGFENMKVLTIALDAHKNGSLPYPAGLFMCRKNLQQFVEIHVPYILGHSDDTLSGSRTGITALLGLWFINSIGYDGQKQYVDKVMKIRDEIKEKLKSNQFVEILPASKYTNMLALCLVNISPMKREQLERKYMLRSTEVDGKLVYKICVFPHVQNYIDSFIDDITSEE